MERAPGRYGFAHLTFEEYFTGRALAFRGAATDRVAAIRGRLHDPRYDEPILLALGLIGTDYAEQIESVVAEAIYPAGGSPSSYEHLLGRDFLFLLRVLADDIPVSTATIDAVLNHAADELFGSPTARTRFDTYHRALLARLGELGSTNAGRRLQNVVRDRVADDSQRKPEEFCWLAAAAARCGPLPVPALRRLIEVATRGAFHDQMVAVWALTTDPDPPAFVVDGLIELAVSTSESPVRTEAARKLAALGRLTQPVIDAIIAVATASVVHPSQLEPLEALTASHPLPEQVIDTLAALADSAELIKPSVRETAIRRLAAGDVPSDAQVTALAQLATTARRWDIRVAATQALTRAGVRPASVFTAWTDLAEEATTQPEIRALALCALASYGPLSAALVAIVIDLATGDHETSVRKMAVGTLGLGHELTEPAVAALAGMAIDPSPPLDVAYPTLRVEAVRALVTASALTHEVILEMLDLAASAVSQAVRIDALKAVTATLFGAVELPGPVATELVRLASGESGEIGDDELRLLALQAIGSVKKLPHDVRAAMSALITDSAQTPLVRIKAAAICAQSGQLTGGQADQVAELATSADLRVQVEALQLLASAGVVTNSMAPALLRLATRSAESSVRVHATKALATAPEMTDDITNTLVRVATTDVDYSIRVVAVEGLRKARPGSDVLAALLSRLVDEDNDVRRAAGKTLVSLARQYPDAASGIEAALVGACEDPAYMKVELIGRRSGWDYAYDALQMHLDVKVLVS